MEAFEEEIHLLGICIDFSTPFDHIIHRIVITECYSNRGVLRYLFRHSFYTANNWLAIVHILRHCKTFYQVFSTAVYAVYVDRLSS